ncbi:thioredoxin domain-containing protein 11 [Uranotaenia lowii]|uniref:thioredoxin domain-containing protein 11 n=1 Tax=Uranotaenia lowii TaxID=190385 RepID=UPI0024786D72|nr:thioredoxin domain-containing protein 11 [Uranotaenia lowii]
MSTQIPSAWKRSAAEAARSKILAAEAQRNIRRRISSSLRPWEKPSSELDPSPKNDDDDGSGQGRKVVSSLFPQLKSNKVTTSSGEFDDDSSIRSSSASSVIYQQTSYENAKQDDVDLRREFSSQLSADGLNEIASNQLSVGLPKTDGGCELTEDSILAGSGITGPIDPANPDPPMGTGSGRRYSRISMIIIYGREVLCILALILTTYASIHNSPPKISKAPPPVPFFSRGSLVHDWPSGALGPTQTRVSQSELSFVFYYAPWCAESQNARAVYEHVARLYYREAHFAAINCWQPGGECRLHYSKVQSWPVLMAYQPNAIAVQFHQSWTNGALARFVQSLLTPLHRLTEPGDLMSLMTGKDAVVVAFLDMELNRRQYNRFYQTSLKWLEKDPFQEVAFGIVTGDSAAAFGLEEIPAIRLYLWNETIEFTGNSSWTHAELIGWVNKHIQVVSMWIAPPGASKSASLAPYFKQGPVLFFFTPRPLYGAGSSDAYMMLRQLGMLYYNCQGDIWVQEMATKYIAEQRRYAVESYGLLKDECKVLLKQHPAQNDGSEGSDKQDCKAAGRSSISVSFVSVMNSSKFVEGKQKVKSPGLSSDDGYCNIEQSGCDERFFECGAMAEDESLNINAESSCSSARGRHSSLYGSVKRDGRPEKHVTSMLDAEEDYRGPKVLSKQFLRRQCELLRFNEQSRSEVFFPNIPSQSDDYIDLIQGSFCKYNKTLTFLGMDSDLYHAFAERLGVDVLSEPNRSVAIIVDQEVESTYRLQETISLSSLAKLVHSYYNRTQPRYLRSSNVFFKNTHSFNTSEFRKESRRMADGKRLELKEAAAIRKTRDEPTEQRVNGSVSTIDKTSSSPAEHDQQLYHNHRHHLVREINSRNFQQAVVESNKTVVVHFYSTHCAFCSMLSQHLLTISRLLKSQPGLEFVRVDGDRNDMRWEYSMELFPTLIIFPNQRKSESRVFERELPLTVGNLLGFIMSNLSPAERLHANSLLCDSVKSSSAEGCLVTLKRELSSSILLTLRHYRQLQASGRPARARVRLLNRLQVIHEFYLTTLRCFSHSCDFTQLKNSARMLLTLWPTIPT